MSDNSIKFLQSLSECNVKKQTLNKELLTLNEKRELKKLNEEIFSITAAGLSLISSISIRLLISGIKKIGNAIEKKRVLMSLMDNESKQILKRKGGRVLKNALNKIGNVTKKTQEYSNVINKIKKNKPSIVLWHFLEKNTIGGKFKRIALPIITVLGSSLLAGFAAGISRHFLVTNRAEKITDNFLDKVAGVLEDGKINKTFDSIIMGNKVPKEEIINDLKNFFLNPAEDVNLRDKFLFDYGLGTKDIDEIRQLATSFYKVSKESLLSNPFAGDLNSVRKSLGFGWLNSLSASGKVQDAVSNTDDIVKAVSIGTSAVIASKLARKNPKAKKNMSKIFKTLNGRIRKIIENNQKSSKGLSCEDIIDVISQNTDISGDDLKKVLSTRVCSYYNAFPFKTQIKSIFGRSKMAKRSKRVYDVLASILGENEVDKIQREFTEALNAAVHASV